MSDEQTHLKTIMAFETGAAGISAGDLRPAGMVVREALSTLYDVELTLDCFVDGGVAPDVAEELFTATSTVSFGEGGLHSFGGVVREWELLSMEQNGARSQYRAVISPRFWLTTLTRRSRCFNELAFPDVLETVLKETGLASGDDYEFLLTQTYPVSEYIVQYEESDFAFLSRWMERLGIFYFFEQSDGVDKIVFADANSELLPAPDHPDCTHSSLRVGSEVVLGAMQGLRRVQRKLSMLTYVRDFNWRKPVSLVSGRFDIDKDHGTGLQSFYGDHFKDDSEGEVRARVRSQAQACRATEFSALTCNPDFSSGKRVTLTGSPIGEMDFEFLIVAVRHESEGRAADARYWNTVTMIPHATPYRAPVTTAWPSIHGVINARIDAESVSSAAPIDTDGRYRVVIPYDLYGGYGGSATRWVRKAEPYSGAGYGMHFTLHVGAEVLLAHVGGDPDRPMIVGTVPNPSAGTPLTQTDSTRSAIRTRSGILIDFEDDA